MGAKAAETRPRVKIGDVWESNFRRARVQRLSGSNGLVYQRELDGGGLGVELYALVSSFVRGRKLVERDGKAVA